MGTIFTRRLAALALGSASVALTVPTSAVAQEAKRSYSIPAQDLASALEQFGRQSGKSVMFDRSSVVGARSKAVTGTVEPDVALKRLLQGTGHMMQAVNANTFVIGKATQRAPSSGNAGGKGGNWASPSSVSSPVGADEAFANDNDETSNSRTQVIVVTGTNIRNGRLIGQSPTTVTRNEMERAGAATIADFRSLIPQNVTSAGSDISSAFSGQTSAGTRTTNNLGGADGFNLRGIGTGATLTLLNGRRLAPSGQGDITSVGAIPAAAIEQVQVVTDGASSVYGSDAVGGVVNVITRRDFDGLELAGFSRIADQGSRFEGGASAVAGKTWASGNVMAVIDYLARDPLYAKDVSFANPALSPRTSLLPRERNKTGFISANQDISANINLSLDALISRRRVLSTGGNLTFGALLPLNFRSDGLSINPKLRYSIAGGWEGVTYFDYSEQNTAIDLTTFSQQQFYDNKSWSTETTFRGPLFELPAGVIEAAIGGLFRREFFGTSSITAGVAGSRIDVKRDVLGLYGELALPVISSDMNIALAEELVLGLSARWDKYSDGRSRISPRAALDWKIISGIELKFAYSSSFREPTLNQRQDQFQAVFFPIPFDSLDPSSQDPRLPVGSAYVLSNSATGNPALGSETADIFSARINIKPTALPVRLQLGYYNIAYKDVIISLDARTLLNNPAYVDFIAVNPQVVELQDVVENAVLVSNFLPFVSPGVRVPIDLTDVQVLFQGGLRNVAQLKTSGIDFLLSYSSPFGGGSLDLTAAGTYIFKFAVAGSAKAPLVENVDTVLDPIDLKARLTAAFTRDNVTLFANATYIDGYIDDVFSPDRPRRLSSRTTVDTGLTLKFGDAEEPKFRLSFLVKDLFNSAPPRIDDRFGYSYDTANHSPLGRVFSIQAASRF